MSVVAGNGRFTAIAKLRDYWSLSQRIGARLGRPAVAELGKLLLHRAVTGYGNDHYLTYELYRLPASFSRWREYVDKRDCCRILFQYNDRERFAVLQDKVAFADACKDRHLPHPAVFGAINYPRTTSLPIAHDQAAVHDLLQGLAPSDYIVKACDGSYGEGFLMFSRGVDGIHAHSEACRYSLEDFAQRLAGQDSRYILQERLRPARALGRIMPGEACGTLRVNTLYTGDGRVDVFCAFFKLPVVGAFTDNFSDGTTGNLLALCDLESGAITRAIGLGDDGLFDDMSHHPDTGDAITGWKPPELENALHLARQCAEAFREIPAVGWDIALTDDGPVVLEGNPMFDPIGPQLCINRGIRHILPRRLGADGDAGRDSQALTDSLQVSAPPGTRELQP
ncbi:sugar-transfer associated ATP-grasp domain-containing protein [Parahaliea mediterranea]|uniref:Alpha-L-glutamate ligase-related protein ATP-grasp domain-containing protein n=1 Tax=Parahaliea mediterranea TaxID=651086 RepID=A0A939DEP5_9GAMM|nr:sugar-transfer associated ATP-grasp domain-containing protein [Parahaliea mediterranea]MBN7796853.1 hypothetical protein [Parahaliea mediterranea]